MSGGVKWPSSEECDAFDCAAADDLPAPLFAVRFDCGMAHVGEIDEEASAAARYCDACHGDPHTWVAAMRCLEKYARGKADDWLNVARGSKRQRLSVSPTRPARPTSTDGGGR